LYIPSAGRSIQQTESREDDVYDTVEQASGAVTAGAKQSAFKTITNKNNQHTNLTTIRRIAAGDEFFMNRVGCHIRQATANTLATDSDILLVAENADFSFKLGKRLVTEGPLIKYQSGYGMVGMTNRNNTGLVTIGVASYAAAPQLLVVQPITDTDDLIADVFFNDNSWIAGGSKLPTLANAVYITVFLHGVIKSPLGR
jgi:hypothetical protein